MTREINILFCFTDISKSLLGKSNVSVVFVLFANFIYSFIVFSSTYLLLYFSIGIGNLSIIYSLYKLVLK